MCITFLSPDAFLSMEITNNSPIKNTDAERVPSSTETTGSFPHSSPTFGTLPNHSEPFGKVPQHSDAFGIVPNDAEEFGRMRDDSEPFRKIPQDSERLPQVPKIEAERDRTPAAARSENHTLTVREAVRMFEAANVARSERSIVNWCHRNRQGLARLDAYYDPNERRYYITPQSVNAVIEEERARSGRSPADGLPHDAAEFGMPGKSAAAPPGNSQNHDERIHAADNETGKPSSTEELHRENRDLQITNRAKDMFIEQMKTEREKFLDQLAKTNRQIGVLETKLLQIESGTSSKRSE